MRLYVLPPSLRALKVIALKNHLGLDCEMQVVDLGKDEHLTPEFAALNPNKKMPVLVDDSFVLWESNAILFSSTWRRKSRGAECGLPIQNVRPTCSAGCHGRARIGIPRPAGPSGSRGDPNESSGWVHRIQYK